MYSVYSVVDVLNKPMTFSLVRDGMSRKDANEFASTLRRNNRGSGTVIAVCVGNHVKSLHNRA